MALGDWKQHGCDAQRTHSTAVQVDGPYAYAWKWFEVPFAARAEPVVMGGKLFMPSLNGTLYCRNGLTGAAIWEYATGGAIRNSAAANGAYVYVHSCDGWLYAIDITTGTLFTRAFVGSSCTAPLIDEISGNVYVGTDEGTLFAFTALLDALWVRQFQASIKCTPALSVDGSVIYLGTEDMFAWAVSASTGANGWQTKLYGQSMVNRHPVVCDYVVMFCTMPIEHFSHKLAEDDGVMAQAGTVVADWAADWATVKPYILQHYTLNPAKQTTYVLDRATGKPIGIAPVIWTYAGNDPPAMPAVGADGVIYQIYVARHGIQENSVHVGTLYNAAIGMLNPGTLDIVGLTTNNVYYTSYWRKVRDEMAHLVRAGNLLLISNSERIGGIDLATGLSFYTANLAAPSPLNTLHDYTLPGANPFFPLVAGAPGATWPPPLQIETEGLDNPCIVAGVGSNARIYWRAAGGGLACLAPSAQVGATQIYTLGAIATPTHVSNANTGNAMAQYVEQDLTTPVSNPNATLVARLRKEVDATVRVDGHLLPFYINRGFSDSRVYPAIAPPAYPNAHDNVPSIVFNSSGNAVWHSTGELMRTMAMAYPYLDAPLKVKTKTWVEADMLRYPPLEGLPYNNPQRDWLRQGVPREAWPALNRANLNNFPVVPIATFVLYEIWLWCKNVNDWSYVDQNQTALRNLYNTRAAITPRYYSDIAGLIGYARIAAARGWSDAASSASAAATALTNSTNFAAFKEMSDDDFQDPHNTWSPDASGESLPTFWNLAPEIGAYLRDKTSGAAQNHLIDMMDVNMLPAWWSTRSGHNYHRQTETAYNLPQLAWAGFLSKAWVMGAPQAELMTLLDSPWCVGDLYSIQKLAVAIGEP